MSTRPSARPWREVVGGVRTALSGFRAWGSDPGIMALGVVPGLITLALLGAALAALVLTAGDLGGAIGDRIGGEGWFGNVLAVAATLALLIGGALVAIALFTTLALAIGQPFFEAISRRVDARRGGLALPAAEEPWARALLRGLGEGARTIAISVGVSLALVVVGLIPIAGTATAFALGAIIGGRLLAIELTAYPMARRGIVSRQERIVALRPHRWRTVAFGATVFLLFLVPLGALLTMPAAVVGATLLTRHATTGD